MFSLLGESGQGLFFIASFPYFRQGNFIDISFFTYNIISSNSFTERKGVFMKKIVMTGGGTAGHVTPNIALMPALKEAGYDIHYIGSYTGDRKSVV